MKKLIFTRLFGAFAIFLLGLAASGTRASAAGTTYSVAGVNPFPSLPFGVRLVSGDFNNDGNIDILYQNGSTSGTNISVQLGNGNGTFQAAINQPTAANFTSGPFTGISFTQLTAGTITLLADLNGDGRVDVIDNQGSNTAARVLINGVGGFSVGTSPFPIQQFTSRFVFGDFNNDGLTDVLNQPGGTGTTTTLYLNTLGSPGTFTTVTAAGNSAFTSGPLNGITFTNLQATTVYAVDLNGDGRVDIVDAQTGNGGTPVAVLVYQNTGSGFSSVTSPFAPQPFSSRFVFGDFNGDGYVDALNMTSDSNGTTGGGTVVSNTGITLYLNNGTGSFAFTAINKPDGAGANFPSGPFSGIDFTSIVYNGQLVADFDRDTLPEVVDSQNSASRYLDANVTAPLITSSTPANAATGVSTGTSIVLNFNKTVSAGAGNIRIKKTSDNSTVQTIAANGAAVSGSGTSTITITPPSALAGSTAYYLTFDINCFIDSNSIPLAASSGITRVPITSPSFLGFTTVAAASPTTITSLNRVNANPSNATTVNWTLTFASAVTGVSASNFSLSGAAATGASVGPPSIASGGGLTWNVPVTTGSTDGTLTLSFANATGTTPGVSTTLPFTTAGQSYTMDKTRPTVSIGAPSVSTIAAGAGSVTYAVTYADTNFASSSLTTPGITLNTTGTANGTVGLTGSGTSYTVTISTITGVGTLGITVGANTSLDTATNANLASSASTTFAVTAPPPAVVAALGSPASQYSTSSTMSFTVNAGTDRLLVVALGDPNTFTNPTAVTFNGTPMLQANATNDGQYSNDAIWYLKLGTGGSITGNIVVTFAAGGNVTSQRFIGASAYSGVDQTTPVDISGPKISGSVTGSNLGSSLNVTSQTGDAVFDLFDSFNTPSATTVTTGASQTLVNDAGGAITPSGGFGHYTTSTEAGAPTVTMSWTSDATAVLHLTMNINAAAGGGGAPEIVVTESAANVADGGSLSFGTTNVGSPVTKTFTVTNTGTATLNLSALAVPSGFSIAQNFDSSTVASGGGTTTFQITMTAAAAATPSGSVTFTSNDADEGSYDFTVSGTVNPLPQNVTITVPAGVGFTLNGVPYVGTQTVPLAPGTYTLSTTTPQSLAAGTRAVFNSWSDAGAISHSITVASTPLSITGSFTTQHQLTTAASPGAGGTVTPASGTFYDAGTVVSVTATNNSGYVFSNWTGLVASASSAATTVTMDAPKSVTANFAVAAPEIAVSGNGQNIADGSLLAAATATNRTDFGSTPVQGGVVEVTYTITNSGTAALNLTGGPNFVTVTPSTDFSVTQQPAGTVASGGGTTTFKIAFNPTTAATTSATVSFGNNDSDENPFDFVIKGTGTPPRTFDLAGNAVGNTPFDGGETYIYTLITSEIAVEQPIGTDLTDGVSTVNFGSVEVLGTKALTFTIRNLDMSGTMNLGAITFDGANAGEFTVTTAPAATVSPNGSTTMVVTFRPLNDGARVAAIHIANDDADENPFDIILNGTGRPVVGDTWLGTPPVLTTTGPFDATGLSFDTDLGFVPTIPSGPIVFIHADGGITGQFNDLPDGGVVAMAIGGVIYYFQVDYGPNDITLTPFNPSGPPQWKWLAGPKLRFGLGIFGTLDTASASNNPGARRGAMNWRAPNGSLWLFGGLGHAESNTTARPLNDLWQFDRTLGQWIWRSGSKNHSATGTYGSLGVETAGSTPGSRHSGSAWTDDAGNLWLFGGINSATARFNDLWRFRPSTDPLIPGKWTWMKGSNTVNAPGDYTNADLSLRTPGARLGCTSWFTPDGNLWLFGGTADGTTTFFNDLWRYNIASGNWVLVSGSSATNANGIYGTRGSPGAGNVPGARRIASGWVTPDGSLWLFGGQGLGATGTAIGDLNDLWRYNPGSGQWTWVRGSNGNSISNPTAAAGNYGSIGVTSPSNEPPARGSGSAWTTVDGKMWLIGGLQNLNNGPVLSDVWIYDPLSGNWTWTLGSSTANTPATYSGATPPSLGGSPGARYTASTWVTLNGNIWVFGGGGVDAIGGGGNLSDLWVYGIPAPAGAPLLRSPDPFPDEFIANTAPIASDASVGTMAYVPISGQLSATDADRDIILFSSASPTAQSQGTLQLHANGQWVYTPAPGFIGVSTFQFKANDLYGGVSPVRTLTITVVTNPGDADNDGIADAYEQTHLGGTGADPLGDSDADGQNNYFEYLAGTQPQDGKSYLTTAPSISAGASSSGGAFKLELNHVRPGVNYHLETSTDLDVWTRIGTFTFSVSGGATVEDPSPPTGQPQFYRMSLETPVLLP